MSLLAPWLWPFVALGIVPILIHLLMRRRYRHVRWAALEFVLAALRKRRRRMQYREMILMLLRALALSALGLAAARPSMIAGAFRPLGARSDLSAAIVLDGSLSMQHTTPSGSRFATARRLASEVVAGLPPGSAASLFLAGDLMIDVVPEPSHDTAFVMEQIEKTRPTDGGSSILKSITRAWETLESLDSGQREIYVVTDMQTGTWPKPDDPKWTALLRRLAQARPRPRLYIVNVDDGGRANVALEDIRCEDPIVAAGDNIGVAAMVTCHGAPPDSPITVECLTGAGPESAPRRVGHVLISKPESKNPVRFDFALDSGNHRVELRMAGDRVPGDNAAHLTIPVRDRLRVLIVDGSEADGASPFGGEAAFLRAALLAHLADGEPLMAVKVLTPYALAGVKLSDYNAVILANVETVFEDLATALQRYVRIDGGGLIVFAGNRVDTETMNKRLGMQVLPVRMGVAAQEPDGKSFALSVKDLHHPIVRFFDHPDHRHYLAAASFTRARRLEPRNGGSDSDVVLRFDTGHPAMVAGRSGRGWALVFAIDAARRWTDLPLRPAYLMLMRRAVQYTAQYSSAAAPKRVHDPIIMTVPSTGTGVSGMVTTPTGEKHPALAEPTSDPELSKLVFTDTRSAGFYAVNVAGRQPQSVLFAMNPPPAESDLAAATIPEVEQQYPDLDCTWITPADDLGRIVAASRTGVEIWLHLLILAALCFATEQFLAARWAPKD